MSSNSLYNTLETEFKELIEKIESEVLDLENSQNPEIIHSIFRAIHTIKGNSAMVGMDRLREISHCLETLFSKLRSGEMELNTEIIEIVLKSIDRMKEIILDLKNEANYEVRSLILVLEKFIFKKDLDLKKDRENEDFSLFIEAAKSENKYLSLVDINFKANPSLTLSGWIQKMNSLEQYILSKKIRQEEVLTLSLNQTNYHLPYTLLLSTLENPELFLEKNIIDYSRINHLYSPEKKITDDRLNRESTRINSYLKVPTHVIDDLINLAGEAVIARNQLFRSLNLEEDSEEEIRMNRVSQFINNIYNRLMNVRLQKLNSIFPRLQRVVRDASKSVGKEVRIQLEDQDIELDEVVLEGIAESLMHIIRNSIDHGIETEQERIALNKKPYGEIFFKASLRGGNIAIEIRDDGRGLNSEKIIKKALEKKLISLEESLNLTEDKLTDLIFLPGFSTSENVSEVSGRGVGMDVVLTNFKKFGGNLKIKTEHGKGTAILGVIPQTLSVMPAFIVSVKGNKFALLQKHIIELNKYNPKSILNIDNRKIYKKEERLIPIIDLGELLFPENKKEIDYENIAIIESEEKIFAVAFDCIVSIEEIVLKPLPNQIKDIKLFGGTTFAGDGSAILLLEPEGLIKFSKLQLEKNTIVGFNSEHKKRANTNYLAFEASNQFFLVHASDIRYVRQIRKEQIQFVFEKEMIQLEEGLIHSFRLEDFFDMKQFDNQDNMYCLVIENTKVSTGVLVHNLIDIFDSIEIKENSVIQNNFVEGLYAMENKTALFISLPHVLEKLQVEVS